MNNQPFADCTVLEAAPAGSYDSSLDLWVSEKGSPVVQQVTGGAGAAKSESAETTCGSDDGTNGGGEAGTNGTYSTNASWSHTYYTDDEAP